SRPRRPAEITTPACPESRKESLCEPIWGPLPGFQPSPTQSLMFSSIPVCKPEKPCIYSQHLYEQTVVRVITCSRTSGGCGMLTQLTVSNYAIAERVELQFNRGMTALTGETGAGKSIVLDALGLAMGGRADAGAVRHGAKRADITASFDISRIPEAR